MSQAAPPNPPQQLYQRLLREPTVHFLIIAAIIFAVYGLLRAGGGETLEIDAREIQARILMQEMASGQPLSQAQRDLVTSRYVEEQILVREALAMNLDNDARIHDLLAQKMRHVLSGDIIQPSPAQLQAYYEANPERYRHPARITVDEIVFDAQGPLPGEVTEQLQAGADPDALLRLAEGSTTLLPDVTREDLGNIFSRQFASEVFAADTEQWLGPFASNRGQHWLRIVERRAARTLPLSDIEDQVRLDWIADEEEALLQQEVERLWDKYRVVITDGDGGE